MAKLPTGFWTWDRKERVRALLAENANLRLIADELEVTDRQLHDAIANHYLRHAWSRRDQTPRPPRRCRGCSEELDAHGRCGWCSQYLAVNRHG